MFETVLVADRGLLAVRVMDSCRRLGIKTVTCVLAGDEDARHARVADESIPLGSPQRGRQLVDAVLEAAQVSGAQAVHPGSGGRGLDPALAHAVLAAGLAWVGSAAGAPTGVRGSLSDGDHGATLSRGRVLDGWMWTVRRGGRIPLAQSLPVGDAVRLAVERAVGAEPLIASVALRSGSGGPVAIRPGLMGVDRLVEARTGVDLVELQLRLVAGESPEPVPEPVGYALQAALYSAAETLVPATVRGWVCPPGEHVVVDTVLADGVVLTVADEPLLALVTASGPDRMTALARLTAAVDAIALDTPPSNLGELRALLREPAVRSMVG